MTYPFSETLLTAVFMDKACFSLATTSPMNVFKKSLEKGVHQYLSLISIRQMKINPEHSIRFRVPSQDQIPKFVLLGSFVVAEPGVSVDPEETLIALGDWLNYGKQFAKAFIRRGGPFRRSFR